MQPLNKVLYNRLREEFGDVLVSQPGVAAVRRYGYGHFLSSSRGMVSELKMELDSAGEYYRVNCPYCGDGRKRLWLSHLWGVDDKTTGRKNLWLAICYNEDCLRQTGRVQHLHERVYGFKNVKARGQVVEVAEVEKESAELKSASLPGLCVGLDTLPKHSQPIRYLRSRGLSPEMLQSEYGVCYCLQASTEHYRAQGRLIIPVVMDGVLVGWQGRYPDELDWKAAQVTKYYNLPGMPRRLMLYNFDRAKKYPWVVVCEGPSSVWGVGANAVGCFGKHVATTQLKMLCNNWPAAIVILLDGDAWDDALELQERIFREDYKGAVIPVRLPVGRDPFDMGKELNGELIRVAAAADEIDLDGLKREEHVSCVGTAAGGETSLCSGLDRIRRENRSPV